MSDEDLLTQLASRRAVAELELTSKGYPPAVAEAGVERALQSAVATARHVRPTAQAQVAADLFEYELRHHTETYVRRVVESGTGDEDGEGT